jgi:acyl carrier protein
LANDRSEESIRHLIRDLVLELAPNAELSLEDPRLIDDLEYHSLALLELAFTLEDEFDLEPIDEDAARSIIRASDVETYVIDQLRAREKAAI